MSEPAAILNLPVHRGLPPDGAPGYYVGTADGREWVWFYWDAVGYKGWCIGMPDPTGGTKDVILGDRQRLIRFHARLPGKKEGHNGG